MFPINKTRSFINWDKIRRMKSTTQSPFRYKMKIKIALPN